MSPDSDPFDWSKSISEEARSEVTRLSRLADSLACKLSQAHARLLLPTLIGRLSLDLHDRGWTISLPFTLWESVIGDPSEPFAEEDVALFRFLSEVAGGWAHHDTKAGPRFVVGAVWAGEFAEWKTSQPARDSAQMKSWDRARARMRRLAMKKQLMSPDELVAVAQALLDAPDKSSAATLKIEMMQGFYGKPMRDILVRECDRNVPPVGQKVSSPPAHPAKIQDKQ